jgi:large subunit ribosomal protein L22
MNNSQLNTHNSKTIIARAKFVRTSPRKLRLVADAVRGLRPDKAVDYLKMISKRAATPLSQVFQQGIANAKNNFQVSPGDLVIESLQIEEGPRGPKRMDKSHGARFDRGLKRRRLAHIYLKLAVRGGK